MAGVEQVKLDALEVALVWIRDRCFNTCADSNKRQVLAGDDSQRAYVGRSNLLDSDPIARPQQIDALAQ